MPLFVKTEKFTNSTLNLPTEVRGKFLAEHKHWVENLRKQGKNLSSGYLVNQNKKPGGGGYLVLQASSFKEALSIVKTDPMIKNNLVCWELNEWIPVVGKLLN